MSCTLAKSLNPCFAKCLAMAIGFSAMLASHHAANSRRFCQSRDVKELQRFFTLRFIIRKTFNPDSLRFASDRNWLETALHGSEAQAILVVDYDCCHQSLGH
jgi:hypothetical protein